MKTFLLLFSFSFVLLSRSSLALTAPDFEVKVGLEVNNKQKAWLIELKVPEKHHFNLKAPIKVAADKISFIKVGAEERRIGFRSSSPELNEGAKITASLFLCDNAGTYCLSKTQEFSLKVNAPELDHLSFEGGGASHQQKPLQKKEKKDKQGFWNNEIEEAIQEAVTTHKPMLIDFYGIWCPPCNLYNETVFGKKEFQALSKNWVLLKLDADLPSSFAMKSHFKVGGYPTLTFVKAPAKDAKIENLEEIDRVVGFFPLSEFATKMRGAFAIRNQTLEDRVSLQRDAYLIQLGRLIELKVEKKEIKDALKLLSQGLVLDPKNTYFLITKLSLDSDEDQKILDTTEVRSFLKSIYENRAREKTETLLKAQALLTEKANQFRNEQIAWAKEMLNTIADRVDPRTLFVPGLELSLADVHAFLVDVADAMKDDTFLKEAYQKTAESYERLIKIQKGENSRGLNLEYAYYLWKSGKVDQAKKIYEKMIARYPNEFTFYFAASKMYMELKDFSKARDYAERAVQYAYGDNQIRSMERLIRVMGLQGEKPVAIERGKNYLKTLIHDHRLFVRTERYIEALKKTISQVEAGKL